MKHSHLFLPFLNLLIKTLIKTFAISLSYEDLSTKLVRGWIRVFRLLSLPPQGIWPTDLHKSRMEKK